MEDVYYMKMALALAEKGRGTTAPNPMVGAVVVQEGRIVGRGWHAKAGLPHAEPKALVDAGEAARGATLYVTLEPCNHTGRTPPCTEKIIQSGITRVVVAMADPNPEVAGGGMQRLRQAGISVTDRVCEAQAQKQNEIFIKYSLTKRPFVILKTAATLDGRIATRTGDSKWVTGEKARQYVHQVRHMTDGILVGIGTVLADDPSLTTRLPEGNGLDPNRIILDTRLSIPEEARLLHLDSTADTILVCGSNALAAKKKRLQDAGIQVIEAAEADGKIDIRALMPRLGEMGITSLLIEGGGRVVHSALMAGIVDKALLFYAPKLLAGSDGLPLCSGPGPEAMNQALRLIHIRVKRFDDDIMIEGYLGK